MTTRRPQARLPPDRREALLNYFREVTRDLLARGVIRQQKGQALDSILRAELQTVLSEVSADFGAVAKELGFGLLNGIGNLLSGLLTGRR